MVFLDAGYADFAEKAAKSTDFEGKMQEFSADDADFGGSYMRVWFDVELPRRYSESAVGG